MAMKGIKRAFVMALSVVMLLSGVKVNAAENEKNTVADFEESVDAFFEEKMKEYQIPGAAVSVVENGEVVLEKSYGFSNMKKKQHLVMIQNFVLLL